MEEKRNGMNKKAYKVKKRERDNKSNASRKRVEEQVTKNNDSRRASADLLAFRAQHKKRNKAVQ